MKPIPSSRQPSRRPSRRLFAAAAGLAALALAACGSKPQPQSPPSNGDPPGVVQDTRTELERRRDDACEKLGPKLAQCAVEDSRAMLAAGQITRQQHEEATKPDVQRGLAADWRKKCRQGYMSSRQVRVLEVCFREESECAPLEACLRNLEPDAK